MDDKTASTTFGGPRSEPGVIAAGVYASGKRVASIETPANGRGGLAIVWIGLYEPSLELLARVQAQFDLHPLAIEDAGKPHQHPKLEQYGEALFIVARTAQIVNERIGFGETHIFIGRGYVVTVRHGASTSYTAVRERCESCPTVLSRGEHYILYAILDFIVDNYMPVVETIHDEVEAIEDRVFEKSLGKADVQRLYMLRRDLLAAQRRRAAGQRLPPARARRGDVDRAGDAAAVPRRHRSRPPGAGKSTCCARFSPSPSRRA